MGNKKLLITGGTGSFGSTVLNRFKDSKEFSEIRIFSRDEKKQDDLRKMYNSPKVKFIIGDVRDYNSISSAVKNVDYVFHAAALKQVPACEFFPMEAVKTNILGTENVIRSCESESVKRLVVLSTDKAAYPINAMGMSKALMEKIALASSRNLKETIINVTRYGNVMASRGSVIPLFIEQIKSNKPITITDPKMTRFMMTLNSAVNLVLYTFENGNQGDLIIQKAPASTIEILALSLLELYNSNVEIKIIGTRHGEKRYETLINREDMLKAEDLGSYIRIPVDNRDLNYDKYFNQGTATINDVDEYNSDNTTQLDVEGMKSLLLQLPEIKKDLGIK